MVGLAHQVNSVHRSLKRTCRLPLSQIRLQVRLSQKVFVFDAFIDHGEVRRFAGLYVKRFSYGVSSDPVQLGDSIILAVLRLFLVAVVETFPALFD